MTTTLTPSPGARYDRCTPHRTPRRLPDQSRYVIPIEGEVDGIWQRAFHTHLAEQIRHRPGLAEAEFFEKSLTINPAEIKFRFVDSPRVLPNGGVARSRDPASHMRSSSAS